jgi:hypothetical protein
MHEGRVRNTEYRRQNLEGEYRSSGVAGVQELECRTQNSEVRMLRGKY